MQKSYPYINYRQRVPYKPKQDFMRLGTPLFTQSEKQQLVYKDRLRLFFVKHGNFKITPKAETVPDIMDYLLRKSSTIGAEQKTAISNRDKDELFVEGPALFTPLEKKRIVAEKIYEMIGDGKVVYLLEQDAIKPKAPTGYWNDKINRKFWIKELVGTLKIDPRALYRDYFADNALLGLFDHYGNSPYRVVKDVYPELKIHPWEMHMTPMSFFVNETNRAKATRWLVKKIGKDPLDIVSEDFSMNGLSGLLNHCMPCGAISEAYPRKNLQPFQMTETPTGFFNKKANRMAAVRWLAEKIKKDPKDITYEDFFRNRLGGLICNRYGGSVYKAVREAFPEMKIMPWEMKQTPLGFYDTAKNRIKATKWLVRQMMKKPKDILQEDFHNNRLAGLISKYGGSPYRAIREAYPHVKEEQMLTRVGFFDIKEHRVNEVRRLVKKLKKKPWNVIRDDFRNNKRGGLLQNHYDGSPYKAMREAFPELNLKPWEMSKAPMGLFKIEKNRIAAVKWLVKKIGKEPQELSYEDFRNNGLNWLLTGYFKSSPFYAVSAVFPEYGIKAADMLHKPKSAQK